MLGSVDGRLPLKAIGRVLPLLPDTTILAVLRVEPFHIQLQIRLASILAFEIVLEPDNQPGDLKSVCVCVTHLREDQMTNRGRTQAGSHLQF